MNIAVPGKIVLKSSTSKTLSDRFSEIAKTSLVDNVRNKQRAENVASVKNRRLAAQMTKRMGIEEQSSSKGTVKSRLTIPIANRLGTKRGGQVRGRGGVKMRGQRGGVRGGNVGSRFQRGRGQTRGGRGGSTNRGGGTMGRTTRGGRGSLRGGSGVVRGGRGGQSTRGRGRPANNQRGVGSTRGRGGRGRGGMNKKQPTKEQLDTELDKYMSKTKSVLNSQLDEYMKGSD